LPAEIRLFYEFFISVKNIVLIAGVTLAVPGGAPGKMSSFIVLKIRGRPDIEQGATAATK